MNEMTHAQFIEKVGTEPIQDDLERVNCEHAGEVGHQQCGWCKFHNKPRFMCGCTFSLNTHKVA